MKTSLIFKRGINIVIILLLIGVFLGRCVSINRLCSKKVQKSNCGCDPIERQQQMILLSINKVAIKEVMYSLENLNLNTEIKGEEAFETALKGCYKSSRKIDTASLKTALKKIDELEIPYKEHDRWVDCKYPKQVDSPKPQGIILMDSHLKDVVYCPDTYRNGGSNSDDILKVVASLGLTPYTVGTNLNWSDEQSVINLSREIFKESKKPAIIIIHASAFYEKTKEFKGNEKLLLFLESLKSENVKILVYTRGLPDQSAEDVRKRFENVVGKVNELNDKAYLLVINNKENPCFDNAEVGIAFRNKLREILEKD